MADNYLERRMEEYRAGRLASVPGTRRTSRLGHTPGSLVVEYPQLRVLCLLSDANLSDAVVRAFREVDCKVAFCDADLGRGNTLSQSFGARFYCHDVVTSKDRLLRTVADLEKVWGGIDVLVCDADEALVIANCIAICFSHENIGDEVSGLRLPIGTSPQILASYMRFMAHPANQAAKTVHISLY